jgi:hypothetical protein
VIADGLGRAVAFILAPGQAHELPHAIPLLDRLPAVPKWVVADRGFSPHFSQVLQCESYFRQKGDLP